MADFDDLSLNKTSEAAPPPPPQPRWLLLAAGAILLLALIAVWYYMRGSGADRLDTGSGTEQVVPQTAVTPAEPTTTIEVPPLDESDAFVRDLVLALSQHPVLAEWLTTDQLIRNFTVSVMNVADGNTPAGHLRTIAPEGKLQTRQQAGRTYVDPRSYSRFDGHANAVAALDPAGTARLYTTLKPRIQQAHRELAGASADFDRTLQRAILELLQTPVVEGEVAVEPGVIGYRYADPSLESLSRAQQQLLRMGPRNVRLIQEKLRAMAPHLGISEASLPRERVVRPR